MAYAISDDDDDDDDQPYISTEIGKIHPADDASLSKGVQSWLVSFTFTPDVKVWWTC